MQLINNSCKLLTKCHLCHCHFQDVIDNLVDDDELFYPWATQSAEAMEDSNQVARKPIPKAPPAEEWAEHCITHWPYRSWCPACVMGRSQNDPRRRNQTRESEVPVKSIDYSFLTDEESLQSMPTLNMIDRHTNYFHCEIVPRKEADQYAATALRTFLENTGYTKLVLKSDQEAAILALIAMVKTQTRIQIIPEQSPAYDHASNGLIGQAICKSTAMQRTLRIALEMNTGHSLEGNWDIVTWLVRHSGNILCWQPRDDTGRSPYHSLKGRKFNTKLSEFGESVYFLECCEGNGVKFEDRWNIGVWLGICDTTNESIIGFPTGVVNTRTWKPIADSLQRRNAECIKSLIGTPWEPSPGVNSRHIRTRVYIPPAAIPGVPNFDREPTLRSFAILRDDLLRYGYTEGCPGCRAAHSGTARQHHNHECRDRFQHIFTDNNDPCVERAENRRTQFQQQQTAIHLPPDDPLKDRDVPTTPTLSTNARSSTDFAPAPRPTSPQPTETRKQEKLRTHKENQEIAKLIENEDKRRRLQKIQPAHASLYAKAINQHQLLVKTLDRKTIRQYSNKIEQILDRHKPPYLMIRTANLNTNDTYTAARIIAYHLSTNRDVAINGDPNDKLWSHPIMTNLNHFTHLHHIYHKDKRIASTCPDLHLDVIEHPHLPQAIKHMIIRHMIHTNRIDSDHPFITVPHEPNYLDHLSDEMIAQVLYDDVTEKPLDTNDVWKARFEELGKIQKNSVCSKVPLEKCLRETGKKPIAVR